MRFLGNWYHNSAENARTFGNEGESAVTSVLIFISGAVLLIFSAEKLIGSLVVAASGPAAP